MRKFYNKTVFLGLILILSVFLAPMLNGQCDLTVFASGDQGTEQIRIKVNGSTVLTETLSTAVQSFVYGSYSSGDVEVEFFNDSSSNGDRNVRDISININGTSYTHTIATHSNTSCNSTDRLFCNGSLSWHDADLVNCSTNTGAADFVFDCDDGIEIATEGHSGSNSFNVPNNGATVLETVVEVVYKSCDPGSTIDVTINGSNQTFNEVILTGGSSGEHLYRRVISGQINTIVVPTSNGCTSNLQSILAFITRETTEQKAAAGQYTAVSGYCDVQNFTIPLLTDLTSRDVTITMPVSEWTNDGRHMQVTATAGGASVTENYTAVANVGCCLQIFELVIPNVPGSATQVDLVVDTTPATNPSGGTGCGQSYVIAGVISANAECNTDPPEPPDGPIYTCDDGVTLDTYAGGCSGNSASVSIPSSGNVYQTVVEITYKGCDPGNFVTATAGGSTINLPEIQLSGTSSNVHVFRAVVPNGVATVSHTSECGGCGPGSGLQSVVAYAYRNVDTASAFSTVETEISGFCDTQTLTIPIPTDIAEREVSVILPISEITSDGRYLTVMASPNNSSTMGSATIFGPGTGQPCCVNLVEVTVPNVPANATSIEVTIKTDSANAPAGYSDPFNNGCGQSYVIAGTVYADVECITCTDPVVNNDSYEFCEGGSLSNTDVTDNDSNLSNENVILTSNPPAAAGGASSISMTLAGILNYTPPASYSGNFSVTYEVCNEGLACCTEGTINITVNDNPSANAGQDVAICDGQSITITANASGGTPGYSYAWNNGLGSGASKTVSPTATTNYVVTVTDTKGCLDTDAVTVTVNDNPEPFCERYRVFDAASGTWSAWITMGASCTIEICENGGLDDIQFDGGPNIDTGWVWMDEDGNVDSEVDEIVQFNNISADDAGVYTGFLTDANGCGGMVSFTVIVNPNPTPTASNNGPITCTSPNFDLSATPNGLSYAWSGPGSFSSTAQNPDNLTVAGTYTVTVTDGNGCTGTSSTTVVTDDSAPNASADNIGGPLTCIDNAVTIRAFPSTAGLTYLWAGPNAYSSDSRTNVVSEPGSYTVTVTDPINGCTAVASTTVIQDITAPNATASNNGPLTCDMTNVTLTAGPSGLTYAWSGPGGFSSTMMAPSVNTAGTYTVIVTDPSNGCTDSATTTVVLDDTAPNATADNTGGPLTCIDNAATIRAFPTTAGLTYAWSGPSGYSSTNRTNAVSVPGTYTVVVTDPSNGCTASAATTVIQDIVAPNATASNNGPLTCDMTSVTLTAGPSGLTYAWSGPGGFTSASRTPSVSTAGTYTVIVTDPSNGCTDTATTTVAEDITAPNATASNNGPLTCDMTSVTLTAGPSGFTYAWSGPAAFSSTSRTPSTSVPGTYTVIVTDPSNGCTATATTTVAEDIENPAATADNIWGPLTCDVNLVRIRAFPTGLSYSWSGPGSFTASSRVADISTPGVYNVTVTDPTNGCTAVASTEVMQNVIVPNADAGNNQVVCDGESATLTATGGGTYAWSTGETTASITVSPAIQTTYTVTVTDSSNGCTATDQVNVSIFAAVNSGISGPDEVCAEEFAVFEAMPAVPGATYAWSFDGGTTADGDTDDIQESAKWTFLQENTVRTITLTVTSADGCAETFTKDVFVKPGVFIATQDLFDVCQGGQVQIGPDPSDPSQVPAGATFTWFPNFFLSNANVAQPVANPPFDIEYTLTIEVNGCSTSIQVNVDVDVALNPIADAGDDHTICEGESIVIGGNPTATPPPAGGAIAGVIWSPSGSLNNAFIENPTATPDVTTEYQVIVVSTSGCADTSYVTVNVDPLATIGNYVWSDDNANGLQDANEAGIPNVTVNVYDTGNVLQGTDVTDGAGNYEVELCPGDYRVEFINPDATEYRFTSDNASNDALDSDASPVDGRTAVYTLDPAEVDLTVDAGFVPLGTITGNVSLDDDNNDTPDTPQVGVTVQLKDAAGNVLQTTTTDANGDYEFIDLDPGVYQVMVMDPADAQSVSDEDEAPDGDPTDNDTTVDNTVDVVLDPGEDDTDNDFVDELLGTITGNVSLDDDNNDTPDTPQVGVTVQLKDGSGNVLQTTTTDANGDYEFIDLEAGDYQVMVMDPNGADSVSDEDEAPDGDPTDNDTTVDNTVDVRLTAGEDDTDNDFVDEFLGTITGNVSLDDDNNDTPDTPQVGVTVQLKDAAGNVLQTTTTDANGDYAFIDLAAGDYQVMVMDPADAQSVSDEDETPDGDPTDNDTTVDNTVAVRLTAGEDDTDNDFVDELLGTISGNVSEDTDNDDIGDAPIAGVTITLMGPGGTQTMVTDANGDYEFTGLEPGEYTITEQPEDQIDPDYVDVFDGDETPEDVDDAVDALNDDSIEVTLTPGEDDDDNNFVEEQLGTISGNVSEDTDNDDIGDAPIAGVTITLMGPGGTQTMVTDANGDYEFTGLEPGEYTITEQPEDQIDPDYVDVFDGDETPEDVDDAVDALNDDSIEVTLTPGEDDDDNNFVEEQLGSISGNVSLDNDNDGTPDSPQAGVTVTLLDDMGNVIATTTTDSNGDFTFDDVEPGDYTVITTDPADSQSVSDEDETPDGDTGDSDTTVDNSIDVTVDPGEDDEDNDFVDELLGTISGNVSEDTTGDGLGDSPIAGVTITLVGPGGSQTTVTDANGDYEFTGLESGNYTVTEQPEDQIDPDYVDVFDGDETPEDGNDAVDALNDDTILVTLDNNEDDADNNFVETQLIDVELLKTVDVTNPNVGDLVTFTLNVSNLGPATATNVAVQDMMPNGYANPVNISNGGSAAGNNVNWSGITLAVNQSIFLTFQATVQAPGAGVDYDNIAQVTAHDQMDIDSSPNNDDGDQSEDDEDSLGPDLPVLPQVADLSLIKTVNDASPEVGDVITFTITVSNAGPDAATNVVVEDAVPTGYADISNISNGGSLSGTTIAWDIASLASGQSMTRTFDATVLATGDYVNVAEITAVDQFDPDSTPDNGADTDGDGMIGSEDPDGSQDPDDEDDGDDAVVVPSASIGDFVFEDEDGDGIQDPNEDGINGVTVSLFEDADMNGIADGPAILTTTTGIDPDTGNDGFYEFTDLTPGSYIVGFTAPNGLTTTTPNANGGSTDATDVADDSDVIPSTGLTHTVVLSPGEDNNDIDAGYFTLLTLGNTVFLDDNNNGINDPAESGIANVELTLWEDTNGDNIPDVNTGMVELTDADGNYRFTGLVPGDYIVQIAPMNFMPGSALEGLQTSTGNDPVTDPDDDIDNDDNGYDPNLGVGVISQAITLVSSGEPTTDGDTDNTTNLTVDFGFFGNVSLGDYVFDDLDGDGVQDPGEPGIAGVPVTLYDANNPGVVLATTTTGPEPGNPSNAGYYEFVNLSPGTYYVEFGTPAGFAPTTPNSATSTEANDSDVDGTFGPNTTAGFTITSGNNPDIDAGFVCTVSIGNFVFIDEGTDANIQDAGDTGINGVVINLFEDTEAGTANDDLVATMVTANDPVTGQPGYYLFDNLLPGNYYINVELPDGYSFVVPNQGFDDTRDSDIVDFIENNTLVLTLNPCQHIDDVDIGLRLPVVPVELTDFYGEYDQARNVNALTWITATEINNDHFVVERAINQSNDFEAIATVDGNGNTTSTITYTLDDKDLVASGTYFYRLRQVDFDGTEELSNVISIRVEEAGTSKVDVNVFPNPTQDYVTVSVDAVKATDVNVTVYNLKGQIIVNDILDTTVQSGNTNSTIDLSSLSTGTYILRIKVGNNVFVERLSIID